MFPKLNGYSYLNNSDTQCRTQAQAQEAHRQSAIASCVAGNMTAATAYYNYGKQSASLVSFSC